jgi:sarcosine oxidase subunit gamma
MIRKASARMSEIVIEELSDRGMIDLKGDPSAPGFRDAVASVLGLDLPLQPRTSESKGEIAVLWLSVDQWLITLPYQEAALLAGRLQAALGDHHALVVDLSDARSIFRISGLGAREVVMKGASADLTHTDYRAGTVRRLGFAELAAMVHVVSDRPEILDLYVFRSVGHYVREFLETAAMPESRVVLWGRNSE